MELNDLRETLVNLENNLKNLDSARKQVEKVATRSDNVTNSTKQLLLTVEDLIEKVNNNSLAFDENFSDRLEEYVVAVEFFMGNISTQSEEKINEINRLSTVFAEEIRNNITDFNSQTITITNTFKEGAENIIKEQRNSINDIVNLINSTTTKQKEEFENLKKGLITELKKQGQFNKYILIAILISSFIGIALHFI